MNSFPGAPPKPVVEALRFDSPAVVLPRRAEPADAGNVLPVPPEPSTGSLSLAGLPPSSALRAKWQQARKARDGAATKGHADSSGAQHLQAEDLLNFGGSVRVSSRQSSSGEGSSHDAPGGARHLSSVNFLQAAGERPRSPVTHMARHALALPALCEAHAASRGMWTMPGFLRETMQSLVIDFTHDLADRIEHRVTQGAAGRDAISPVRDACEEFLQLMRPLYQRYVPTAHLYDEACEVLCGAQATLQKLMQERAGNDEFSRIMRTTICPLFPVFVMACKPRDNATGDSAVDTAGEAA